MKTKAGHDELDAVSEGSPEANNRPDVLSSHAWGDRVRRSGRRSREDRRPVD